MRAASDAVLKEFEGKVAAEALVPGGGQATLYTEFRTRHTKEKLCRQRG